MGYDIHRLRKGKKLFLGGIEVPFFKGLIGHSDGDCLIHAVMDALLGALGEEDIGKVFPDTDPEYKDIRSTELLKEVVNRVKKNKWEIAHIDTIIIAEAPQLADYIPRMKDVLCPLLFIPHNSFGIKAKTNEGIGAIGEGEAMAALAQVLLKSD
jgi:2-C-methyl-D-erythritol 2,4-cyclodiphosphate synthase